jgi:hypothetical protein
MTFLDAAFLLFRTRVKRKIMEINPRVGAFVTGFNQTGEFLAHDDEFDSCGVKKALNPILMCRKKRSPIVFNDKDCVLDLNGGRSTRSK